MSAFMAEKHTAFSLVYWFHAADFLWLLGFLSLFRSFLEIKRDGGAVWRHYGPEKKANGTSEISFLSRTDI